MFIVNEDMSIYVTRGDIIFFGVTADENGGNYKFQPGDVVRIKVFEKKACENVAFQKDFPVTEETEMVEIFLSEEETKIGEVISKPTDYWYEVELNPYTNPQTIIGYDDEGPKIFKLYPEGKDIEPSTPSEEDIPVVDNELDLTSTRPVQNQAIARAITKLGSDVEKAIMLSMEAEETMSKVGVNYDLLWENTEPGNAISDNTNIKIGADILSNYDNFCITYKYMTTNAYDQYYVMLKNRHANDTEYVTGVPGGHLTTALVDFCSINGVAMPVRRLLMVTSDGESIYIGKCVCVSAAANDEKDYSNYLIPCKIYGVVQSGFVNQDITGLQEDINNLLNDVADLKYTPIDITKIANNVSTVEIGTVVNEVVVSWTLNKEPASQTLDGETVEVSARSKTLSNLSLGANRTFTLAVTDERDATDSASTTVSFVNGVYYGVVESDADIDSAKILTMTRKLQSSKGVTFTVDAGEAQQILYAIPTRYGTPNFNVGGFEGGFSLAKTFDFTNGSGYTESYDVWLSENTGLGSTTVKAT